MRWAFEPHEPYTFVLYTPYALVFYTHTHFIHCFCSTVILETGIYFVDSMCFPIYCSTCACSSTACGTSCVGANFRRKKKRNGIEPMLKTMRNKSKTVDSTTIKNMPNIFHEKEYIIAICGVWSRYSLCTCIQWVKWRKSFHRVENLICCVRINSKFWHLKYINLMSPSQRVVIFRTIFMSRWVYDNLQLFRFILARHLIDFMFSHSIFWL